MRDLQSSFTGGEISPALHERVDFDRYQNSLALCKNWFIHSTGGVSNRPGFEYVGNAAINSSILPNPDTNIRLIPFEFNNEQAYVLVFDKDGAMRIIQNNEVTVVSIVSNITSISKANPAIIRTQFLTGLAVSDEIILRSVNGMPEITNRFLTIKSWTGIFPYELHLEGYNGETIDSTNYEPYISGGQIFKVLSIPTPYAGLDLKLLKYTQSADVLTLTHPDVPPYELTRTLGPTVTWSISQIDYDNDLDKPVVDSIVLAGTVSGAANRTYGYVVTAIDAFGKEGEASDPVTINQNALSETCGVKLGWSVPVAGAILYNIYKLNSVATNIYGFIGQTESQEFTDFNLGPDMSVSPPILFNPFVGGDNPFSCEYHQQRLVFGGTTNSIQRLLFSKSGLFDNLDYSSPSQATDSIDFTIATKKVHEIRHLISLSELMLLTSGGEWRVSADQNGVLTPSNINPRAQGNRGSSHVRPVVVGDSILYVQSRGSRIRDLNYDIQTNSYSGDDLTVMVNHLFKSTTIVDLCFSQEPNSVLWAVRSDGILLSLTYVKEHGVLGWAQHTTDGFVESVTCIPEGPEDIVYVSVRRIIEGHSLRYIERLHEREYSDIQYAFFVDSGLTYEGAATTTITNLHHLEGKTVVALADGNVVLDLIVIAGIITLPTAAEIVIVGLPYECDLQTLNISVAGGPTMQTRKKSTSRLGISMRDTRGLKWGNGFDKMYEFKERNTNMAYDNIPEFTGLKTEMISTGWTDGARVSIRQDLPLPATVLAIIPEIEVNG